MRSLRLVGVLGLVAVGTVTAGLPAFGQDTGSTADRPFLFFTPGLAIWNRDTNHDAFFDSIATTLVLPFSPHASAVTTWDLQFRDKPRWSAAANYDWFLPQRITLRASAGLIDDQLGARAVAFRPLRSFGTGLRVGVVGGEFEAGGFLSTPLTWGFPLRKDSIGERLRGRNRVDQLGASTAVAFSVRGGKPDLSTEPLYFYPRNANWPRAGQGPQGAAATMAEMSAKPQQAWVAETGGPVKSSAAIEGDTAYLGSDDGYLYALNLRSGALRWRYRLGAPVSSSPAVADGRVYVGCDDGAVYCLSAGMDRRLPEERVGKQLWRYRTEGPVVGCPLVTVSGLAVVGSRDGTIYALNAGSGRREWTHKTNGPVTASPVRSAGQIQVAVPGESRTSRKDVLFCGSEDGSLYALAERDGTLLWRVATNAPITGSAAVADDVVFVANQAGRVLALRASSGQEVWNQNVGGEVRSSLTLAGRRVIVPLVSGQLTGLDLPTGAPVWKAQVPAELVSTPAAAGGRTLFVGSTNGRLYSVDLRTARPTWEIPTQGAITASPAIAHGVLVCGSQDGSVYGLAGRAPAEGAARPDLGTARPDEGTAPSKPAWTPPPGWSDAPPARATEAAPAPTAPAAVSEAPSEVAMRLISEPSDGSEFPVQLTSTRRTVVAWGTTEPEAEVDGQPVRNEGGQIRVDRSFEADGIYPVVMVTGKGTDREVTQCRLVVVDTSDEPASRREAAFSPDGNGVGDTIAFRARAQGLNGRRVTGRTIDICRPSGEPVLSWVALGDGEDAMIWDGRDAAGSPAPVGTYVVIFSATDDAGKVHRMRQTVIVTRAGERVVGR